MQSLSGYQTSRSLFGQAIGPIVSQYMKVQETILKAFVVLVKGKVPNSDHSDLTLKLTLLWTR